MNELMPPDDRFFNEQSSPAVMRPGAASEATKVEQARAVAEVAASIRVAMEQPRNRSAALAEMREVCAIQALAERAFFRVPRAGEQINGETIHLARELARIWGNIAYGVKELSRDDARGQSELLAFAWDMQTNARSEINFIVPHVKGKANRRLTGTQEIYENNASFAGRRLREAIFAVLPVWLKEEAKEICHRTLESGGGKPLVQRVADMRAAFEGIGVTTAQLEAKRGRKIDNFLGADVAALGVIFRSISREETTVADEFGGGVEDKPQPDNVKKLEAALAAGTSKTAPVEQPAGSVSSAHGTQGTAPGAQEDGVSMSAPSSGPIEMPSVESQGSGLLGTTIDGQGGVEARDFTPPDPLGYLRGKTWKTPVAWAVDVLAYIGSINDTPTLDAFEVEPEFADRLAVCRTKALQTAQEVEDAIEDRRTLLAARAAQGGTP